MFQAVSIGGQNFSNGLLYEIYKYQRSSFDAVSSLAGELLVNHDFYSDFQRLVNNSSQSTVVTNLSNIRNAVERTNTALSTLGSYLNNSSGSVVSAAQAALRDLSSVASSLTSDGTLAKRLQAYLTYGDANAASLLNQISGRVLDGLSSDGVIAQRLKSYLVTSAGDSAASLLSRVDSRFAFRPTSPTVTPAQRAS